MTQFWLELQYWITISMYLSEKNTDNKAGQSFRVTDSKYLLLTDPTP